MRYEVNVLGTKGPRKMTAMVPAIDMDSGQPVGPAPSIHADNSIMDRSAFITPSCAPLVQHSCLGRCWHASLASDKHASDSMGHKGPAAVLCYLVRVHEFHCSVLM